MGNDLSLSVTHKPVAEPGTKLGCLEPWSNALSIIPACIQLPSSVDLYWWETAGVDRAACSSRIAWQARTVPGSPRLPAKPVVKCRGLSQGSYSRGFCLPLLYGQNSPPPQSNCPSVLWDVDTAVRKGAAVGT